jgi:5'-nucleotidase
MPENIVIARLEKLEAVKLNFKSGGAQKIHILSDFDRTLTTAFVQGKSVPSLISVLRDGDYLTPGYRAKAQGLYNKYHPIEIDSLIPLAEKKKAMEKWWRSHFELLIQYKLNKKDMVKVVESGKVKLRQGAGEFFDLLHKHSIPLVIMSSSGLGCESISLFLEKQGYFFDNIHIASNIFEWDKDGYAVKVREPIIHAFNKDETMVRDFPFFESIKNRKNVLLLGDSLGDIGMIEGFEYDNLIKIGFLNEAVEQNLPEFKKNFDVVLLNDSSMDYVNELLKDIIRE